MSFTKSRSVGNAAENQLVEFLTLHGASDIQFSVKENAKDFDVKCSLDGKELTFEVKYDVMEKRTKNIAIEVHNTKKNEPSGIYATKATFWIHKLMSGTYIAKTVELKNHIETTTPDKTVEFGGDKNARLFLYKSENLLKQFKELTIENLRSFL